MNFEISKEFITHLSELIESDNRSLISESLQDVHHADIAELLDELDINQALYVFKILPEDITPDVLVELEEDVREKLLEILSPKEIAEQVDSMDSDDATDIIQELPEEQQEQILSEIEDEELTKDIEELLSYDEDTAGGLMGKEFIKVNENWTTATCVKEMRQQAKEQEIEDIYSIYVVDENEKLLGTLSLKSLITASPRSKIQTLYREGGVQSVTPEMKNEEVANIMKKYDLPAIPVIDENEVLIGRITFDDVVDVIKEEAEKDYQMASGLSESVESSDSIWLLTRARLPWLLVGLLGGILGAQVIGLFESEIELYPKMALFIPLIAAMGGNVGVQSSAIIVQGLANNSLESKQILSKLVKEFSVAALNGLACTLIIFLYVIAFDSELDLAFTISTSLFSVIIFAGIFGTLIPLLLNKYKIDPALATGPFITTLNDVFGLLLYFLIGTLMYFQ